MWYIMDYGRTRAICTYVYNFCFFTFAFFTFLRYVHVIQIRGIGQRSIIMRKDIRKWQNSHFQPSKRYLYTKESFQSFLAYSPNSAKKITFKLGSSVMRGFERFLCLKRSNTKGELLLLPHLKVALSQKVEVDFPNCPKWVPKQLSWDLKNENADFFCIYRFNQLIDNASRTYL